MIQKIIIKEDLTLDQLKQKIDNGAEFVCFQYCISLVFAITLKRFSSAILIESKDEIGGYRRKYNWLSLIFGWWGIPWGPFYTISSLRLNKKGGIDMTEDIMLNIDESALDNREVEMEITNQLFNKPDKWDIKEFKKAFLKEFERDYNVRKIVVARFINTAADELPYLTIGVQLENDDENFPEKLRTAYETRFKKSSYYELLDLDVESDECELLEKQGEYILKR